MRWAAIALAGLSALVAALPTHAASVVADSTFADDSLYGSRVVTSGTSEDRRMPAFAACLENVLVKVSGNARLLHDPRVDALKQHADTYVSSFDYRDLYSGIPLHDEQGSYDRPHYLSVDFDPAKIDTALAGLGLKPWTAPRPKLVVFLGVDRYGKRIIVDATSDRDKDMRESFANAARRYGAKIMFPDYPVAISGTRTFDAWMKPDEVDLDVAARAVGGGSGLVGTLTWSDTEHGWIADWRAQAGPRQVSWQIRGVSFDDAFRNAILGANQVLSGNGDPVSNLLP